MAKSKDENTKTTIEDEYKKLTELEHLLIRPDTKVGQIKKTEEVDWVFNKETERMEERKLIFSPGAVKVVDEILVNARDQSVKSPEVTQINVVIDRESGQISVENNGPGIPVVIHGEHNMWLPQMIFGEFNTGSNFNDDTQNRICGGKNGIGSKATNGLSTYFQIDTRDYESGKRYVQEWRNNMSQMSEPIITSHKSKTKSGTTVSFILDWKRFGMNAMEQDFYDLIVRRVYDIAACTSSSVSVKLNGEKLPYRDFEKYVNLFIGKASETPRVHAILQNEMKGGQDIKWEVTACISTGGFQHMSFVNGLYTKDGGKHVDFVTSKIYKPVKDMLAEKSKKGTEVQTDHIKQQLRLFINAIVVNPDFGSQSKTKLTSKISDFQFECNKLPDEFIKNLVGKCKLGTIALSYGKFRSEIDVSSKTDGSKTCSLRGIEKLADAKYAGTYQSDKCTIMFTEGDSAKTLAVSGFSVVGREYWGVFPLRGKFVNVKADNFRKNKEFIAFKKIIGLVEGEKYTNTKKLRYGRIMFMTDQDLDGAHIQGLLMNTIATLWPELLLIPGFICCFRTPIVKAWKGKGSNLQIKTWFTQQEFERWRKTESTTGWETKYLKGLGSSDPKDAKRYFVDKDDCIVEYYTDDIVKTLKEFDKAFHKDYVNKRKIWLTEQYDRNDILDHSQKRISFEDFINKSLVHFFKYDLERSLSSMCDGFKVSQRKVFYGSRKKKLTKSVKVFQLSGAVAELADYHHGEASLQGTIVGMAQNYTGSNNINVLNPEGQFGCLDPETQILMWNGTHKRAKDISIGDKLVGDDRSERTVLKLTSGVDDMFDIVQENAKTYRVNSEHILTLCFCNHKKIIWKASSAMWFMEYLLGNTIQSKKMNSLSKDEGHKFMVEFAKTISDNNVCDIRVKDYNLLSESHKEQFRGMIVKNPTKPLLSKITVKPVGKGKFVGWQVDKNERFLLHDFTVTHNSRVENGKDSSAARYIMTKMNEISNYIFDPSDDQLLTLREDDDGEPIEPTFYIPIIPMILVNGSDGIGTGFSTNVPAYNPKDIIQNIRNLLRGKDVYDMTPWYKDFKGTIEKIDSNTIVKRISHNNNDDNDDNDVSISVSNAGESSKFKTTGVYERVGDTKIRITELPVGNNKCKSFTAYKEYLETLVVGKAKTTNNDNKDNNDNGEAGKEAPKKKRKLPVKEFLKCDPEENGSDDYCDFLLTFTSKEILDKFIAEGTLESKLKLCHTITTSNMYMFNENDIIEKYNSVADVLRAFYTVRLDFYVKRKSRQLQDIQNEIKKFHTQMQFLTLITSNQLQINNVPKEIIAENLKRLMPELEKDTIETLLKMGIHRLTKQEIIKLQEKINQKNTEYIALESKSPKDIWEDELKILEDKIEQFNKELLDEKLASQTFTKKPAKKRVAKKQKNVKVI